MNWIKKLALRHGRPVVVPVDGIDQDIYDLCARVRKQNNRRVIILIGPEGINGSLECHTSFVDIVSRSAVSVFYKLKKRFKWK